MAFFPLKNLDTQNIRTFVQEIIKYNLLFLILLFSLRSFEYIFVVFTQSLPEKSVLFVLKGFLFDAFYIFIFTGLSIIPFYLLYLIQAKIFRILYFVLIIILSSSYLALIFFFIETLTPLDSSIFNYSWKEIIETTNSYGSTGIKFTLTLFILYAFGFTLYFIAKNKNINKYIAYFFIITSIASLFFIKKSIPNREHFNLDIEYYLTNNKLYYFINKIYCYTQAEINENQFNALQLKKEIAKYQFYNKDFKFTSKVYPLLHQSTDYQDNIGKYFHFKKEKPNIVIIIVESLSRAFSGKEAYLGSFTPFLDSLAEHSLYWENTVSTAERTFGALPSILASVPYGKEGFSYYKKHIPYHISLIELLRKQSYYSSFYYGGWNYFQGMGDFLDFNHIDYMIEGEWGNDYHEFEKDEEGFSWGYPDKDLFRKALEIEKKNMQNPRLDIFLTLNIHSPFHPPQSEYYYKMFDELLENKQITPQEKNNLKKNKNQFAAVLSTDDAIRYYFNQYKKTEAFENTIFIITGDHRMAPIYHRSKIDKYHVPLIIYSPLLKTSKRFKSVASHLDITPTLANLLKNNFQAELPAALPWLGHTLDTLPYFNCTQNMAFMRHDRRIIDYLSGHYFLSENKLYELQENLQLKPIDNQTIKDSISRKLENFKYISLYVCENNKIYPQKEYLNFITYNKVYISTSCRTDIKPDIKTLTIIEKKLDNDIEKGLIVIKGTANFITEKEQKLYIVVKQTDNKLEKEQKIARFKLQAKNIYNKQQGIRITQTIDFQKKSNNQFLKIYFYNPNKLKVKLNCTLELYTKN